MTVLKLAAAPVVDEFRKQDLLGRLDELRTRLEAGEVRELCWCAILSDGGIQTMVGPSDDPVKMLGALERLKIRFHNAHLDD